MGKKVHAVGSYAVSTDNSTNQGLVNFPWRLYGHIGLVIFLPLLVYDLVDQYQGTTVLDDLFLSRFLCFPVARNG